MKISEFRELVKGINEHTIVKIIRDDNLAMANNFKSADYCSFEDKGILIFSDAENRIMVKNILKLDDDCTLSFHDEKDHSIKEFKKLYKNSGIIYLLL